MSQPDARWLARLSRELTTETEVDQVWKRVTDAAVAQVDGAAHAGITVISRTAVSTPVASSDLVQRVDQEQYSTGEGPCLTAAGDRRPVVKVDDLSIDSRWPHFARAATGLGIRSMLSFHLYTDQETLGALNVYAAPAHAFTDDSVTTGILLAAHAAVAATATSKTANLRIALGTRDIIGQAKGILMERYKITAQQAFEFLIRTSQDSNRKIRDIAADLVDTGELTTRDGPR